MSNFYNNNINLKGTNNAITYTEEQISEYLKCKQEPVYFIKNYCKIISLDDGIIPFKLYDYQVRFIEALHNENRIISMQSRQMGKCFEKSTKYKVRNKTTGETLYVNAEEFHKNMQKL